MRYGRVVILLQGRYAGRKAVIVKSNDEGSKVCLFLSINANK